MKALKEIFEQYQVFNAKGKLLPILETELGKSLFSEVNDLLEQSHNPVSGELSRLERLEHLVLRLERGCSCGYDDRCSNCQAIINAKEFVRGNDR